MLPLCTLRSQISSSCYLILKLNFSHLNTRKFILIIYFTLRFIVNMIPLTLMRIQSHDPTLQIRI